jgi:alkanesulfonate monooxygenase SsuD/methylene tetrahydromethanopterin reductase-like flavin-dependent oxidoreductase (luciferase family)
MDEQVARMRAIWRGEPPFEDVDPVGPAPLQAGGPPLYAGVMGPKATARAARWADGVYVWSGNGVKSEIAHLLAQSERAWQAAGRDKPPRRIGGFWYSLAPQDPLKKLQSYVYDYVAYFGDGPARAMSSAMDRATPDAVRQSLDDLEAAGCEEAFLVPATAELAEVERVAEIVSRRN